MTARNSRSKPNPYLNAFADESPTQSPLRSSDRWIEPEALRKAANRLLMGFNEGSPADLDNFWGFLEYISDKCLKVSIAWSSHLVIFQNVPDPEWKNFKRELKRFLDSFETTWGASARVLERTVLRGSGREAIRIWIPWLATGRDLVGQGIRQLATQMATAQGTSSKRAVQSPDNLFGGKYAPQAWPIDIRWEGNLEIGVTPSSAEFGEKVLSAEVGKRFESYLGWNVSQEGEDVSVIRLWGMPATLVDAMQILSYEMGMDGVEFGLSEEEP